MTVRCQSCSGPRSPAPAYALRSLYYGVAAWLRRRLRRCPGPTQPTPCKPFILAWRRGSGVADDPAPAPAYALRTIYCGVTAWLRRRLRPCPGPTQPTPCEPFIVAWRRGSGVACDPAAWPVRPGPHVSLPGFSEDVYSPLILAHFSIALLSEIKCRT